VTSCGFFGVFGGGLGEGLSNGGCCVSHLTCFGCLRLDLTSVGLQAACSQQPPLITSVTVCVMRGGLRELLCACPYQWYYHISLLRMG
jgi:hypothetical protein